MKTSKTRATRKAVTAVKTPATPPQAPTTKAERIAAFTAVAAGLKPFDSGPHTGNVLWPNNGETESEFVLRCGLSTEDANFWRRHQRPGMLKSGLVTPFNA